jgi:hypothetical protein
MSQQVFEAGVFNAAVRRAVDDGRHHPDLKDDWADVHYVEIRAADEPAARSKLESRYPAANGFVLTELRQVA